MSPYAHKLSCNLVNPTPGLDKDACNCGVHADWCLRHKYPDWADLDLFCNCGLTYHHKDCAAMKESTTTGGWTLIKCTCGFSPEPTSTFDAADVKWTTATLENSEKFVFYGGPIAWDKTQRVVHYTHCPTYLDRQAKCTCDTQGHQPGCVHLIDPYMACNCDYLYDDTMEEKYAAEPYAEDSEEFLTELEYDSATSEGQYYRDWMQANSPTGHVDWCNTNMSCNCTGSKAIRITVDNPTASDYDDAIIKLANLRRLL